MHSNLLPGFATSAETADLEMILAFKDFYVAKADVKSAKVLLDDLKSEQAEQEIAFVQKGENCCRKQHKFHTKEERERRARTLRDRLGIAEEVATIESVSKILLKANEAEASAKQKLRLSSIKAKEEWDKVPRKVNARVDTLRKQQSTVFKFAALIYDETGERPRERPKLFGPKLVYVAWLAFFTYFAGTIAIIALWLISHTNGYTTNNGVDPEDTAANDNALISSWLTAAFISIFITLFVAEPMIQLLRFSLVPFCLRKCGGGTHLHPIVDSEDNKEEIVAVEDVAAVNADASGDAKLDKLEAFEKLKGQKGEKQTRNQMIGNSAFEVAAEIVEGLA
jgi:hypothetical protein